MRSAKPALGVSSTLSEISERTEAVRYSPDRPILWVGWDTFYSSWFACCANKLSILTGPA